MGMFDPEEGKPYGRCNDCGVEVADKDASSRHLSETFEAAKATGGSSSHSVRVLNDDREGRIKSEVRQAVSGAIDDAIEELWQLVDDGGATEEEISSALAHYSDFRDAWGEAQGEVE